FSVTNSGSADADEVLVKVDVYKDGTTELVYTYSKIVTIKAGDTFTDSASFDIPAEYSGTFSGVLSAEYKNTPADLDYDGFDVAAEPTTEPATEESASETETTAATTTAVKTTIENTDSPKTGDNEIPAYMWAISILSIAGLVLLKRTGGGENENE
ncbi:MAG: LPXTG cell wall anchor domain-containing protein, partial [Ruminococcus sp.]|nr:LPXTG cell wall anchor domain-containing protein [Ruminococcus sp.]